MPEHQVLARKYRSQSLSELIGQDVLVRTIGNAIKLGRLAAAYVFTGIRGVGKTSTARILAKSLNCLGADGSAKTPQIDPCGVCENCRAIAEDRSLDVIEMDAASHTGVDDIRDIIEGAQYKPSTSRYKVYIIDEAHMLSKSAWNALLKTLEEPPPFVKFVFATTEVRKVPPTVLSRCQRFDLARVDADTLAAHFRKIAALEQVEIDDDALAIIAKVADGSVRDGLSFLDQAISNCEGRITAPLVAAALGLAGRDLVLRLYDALVAGDMDGIVKALGLAHESQVEPSILLSDLLEATHFITRIKLSGDAAAVDLPMTRPEQERIIALAAKLSVSALARIWAMLVKGFSELALAPSASAALEMVLIRIAYAGLLPSPAEILERVENGGTDAEAKKKSDRQE